MRYWNSPKFNTINATAAPALKCMVLKLKQQPGQSMLIVLNGLKSLESMKHNEVEICSIKNSDQVKWILFNKFESIYCPLHASYSVNK